MNNLKQKNILYGRDPKDVLPHGGAGESIIFKQNSNITDIRVNNALQQLVNNDLYLENKIVAGLDYQPGPEGYQAASAVSALPNGSKRWVASDDYTKPLQIYRKVEVSMDRSIGLVRNKAVSFIAPIGDAMFVAFSDKLMYDAGSGLVDCKDAEGAAVVAVGYCTTPSVSFFVSATRVYRLDQVMNAATGGYSYRLQKIDVGSVSGIKCVQYDADNSMLYIGGSAGLVARGKYVQGATSVRLVRDVKCCADDVYGQPSSTNRYIDNAVFNAFCVLDSRDPDVDSGRNQTNILAATDHGLFRSDAKNFLVVKTASALASKGCAGVAQLGGTVYFLANASGDTHVYKQTSAEDMTFQ